jgi:hypothetical protein
MNASRMTTTTILFITEDLVLKSYELSERLSNFSSLNRKKNHEGRILHGSFDPDESE